MLPADPRARTQAQAQAHDPDHADRERSAFNAAFFELGLRWHWDDATYSALQATPCARQRVRQYLTQSQAHLLRAYDADALADAILRSKDRFLAALSRCPVRTLPSFDWADARWGAVGI